jgi:hypothetical protein
VDSGEIPESGPRLLVEESWERLIVPVCSVSFLDRVGRKRIAAR